MDEVTLELVLERLGLPGPPPVTLDGLREAYKAWCRHVPFDNYRKRLHLLAGDRSPLPGGEPADFFDSWLAHGTGGTCWPTSAATHSLLSRLGFDARMASASMRDMGVPNHGTVIVHLDGVDWLVDASMLLEDVLPLRPGERAEIEAPPLRARAEPDDGGWLVSFTSGSGIEDFPCRMLDDRVDLVFFLDGYEVSRRMSPFNDEWTARRNVEGGVVTVFGRTRLFLHEAGREAEELEDPRQALVEEIGLSEEIVERALKATPA